MGYSHNHAYQAGGETLVTSPHYAEISANTVCWTTYDGTSIQISALEDAMKILLSFIQGGFTKEKLEELNDIVECMAGTYVEEEIEHIDEELWEL